MKGLGWESDGALRLYSQLKVRSLYSIHDILSSSVLVISCTMKVG